LQLIQLLFFNEDVNFDERDKTTKGEIIIFGLKGIRSKKESLQPCKEEKNNVMDVVSDQNIAEYNDNKKS